MMPSQIREEIQNVIRLFDEVYATFGLKYHAELSTRPEDSMGDAETWETTTNALRSAMEDFGLEYVVNEGDGAFYGPKIDFHLTDSIGRTWQCGTIQLDMLLPEKFELTYTGEDGMKHLPGYDPSCCLWLDRTLYWYPDRKLCRCFPGLAGTLSGACAADHR